MVGFEVCNRLAWRINGKNRAEALYDMLLDDGVFLAAVGVDDSHSFEERVTGLNWTGVLVSEPTPSAVLEAVRAHRTYASEGPELKSICLHENGHIVVECSPCVSCHYKSHGFGARSIHVNQPTELFELDLHTNGYRLHKWLYICLEDDRGRRAWSSAIRIHNHVRKLYQDR